MTASLAQAFCFWLERIFCKSGKHWCLVGYTRGGKSAHSLEKCDTKDYHDCIRSLIFRSMHSILSHLLCQWKLKVYTLYISHILNIYISCLWFIYILQAVNILIKRFIYFRWRLLICFSTQFFLYVLYNCIENSKTTIFLWPWNQKLFTIN
jgi:predicted neutral ceramidase superfamily lipid hydrolase